ncbi:MAG: hypothetical protein ACC662_11795 [Planctomycetota bacterium]
MTNSGRRLSQRNRLERPVEAELHLCGEDTVFGWIVDEQDDGVGMMFGAEDAERLLAHETCCVNAPATMWLAEEDREGRPIPVRVIHFTRPDDQDRACRAGLAFDVARMKPQDITHLLGIWRRLVVAGDRR